MERESYWMGLTQKKWEWKLGKTSIKTVRMISLEGKQLGGVPTIVPSPDSTWTHIISLITPVITVLMLQKALGHPALIEEVGQLEGTVELSKLLPARHSTSVIPGLSVDVTECVREVYTVRKHWHFHDNARQDSTNPGPLAGIILVCRHQQPLHLLMTVIRELSGCAHWGPLTAPPRCYPTAWQNASLYKNIHQSWVSMLSLQF